MNKFIFWTMFVITVVVWVTIGMLMWLIYPIIFQHVLIGIICYALMAIGIYHAYHMTFILYEIYKGEF